MPTLEFYRGYKLLSDRNASYKVLVDGALVGKVGPTDHFSVQVPAGKHVINAKSFWCKSDDLVVDLAQDGHALLRLDNDDRPWGELTALLNPSRYIRLTRER